MSTLTSPDLGARGRVRGEAALVDVDLFPISSVHGSWNSKETYHDAWVVLRSVGRDSGQEVAAGRGAAGALDGQLGALGVELRSL